MTRPARCLALLSFCLLAAGCAHRSSTSTLEDAARDAAGSGPSARALSLAGFHAYLIGADPAKAQSRFDAALKKDPSDPYALYGQILFATRNAHPERALEAALDLCERAPVHPLSTTAARLVLDMAGTSPAMDELILARSSRALAAGSRGDAAHLLRSAVATIQGHRSAPELQTATLKAMGSADRLTLVGPFSVYHLLGFDEPIAPEQTGSLAGPLRGPFGDLRPRNFELPDGRLSLAGEGPVGDIYVFAVDVEATEKAVHVVRSVTSVPHKLYLDGTLLFQRRSFERFEPTVSSAGVELSAGRHRVVIKLAKEDRSGSLSLSLMRADGKPANLRFLPAEGRAPRWDGVSSADVKLVYPSVSSFAQALADEAGQALAEFIAVRDGMVRDRDGAKRLMASLSKSIRQPGLGALRGEVALGDRTIPSKVARGRATGDLETATTKDRADVNTLLSRATLALEDGRLIEASEFLKLARDAHRPVGYPLPMVQARVELALGLDAQADQSALEALAIQPGLCDALSLRYDLARRREAIALSDKLVQDSRSCPGALSRTAEHARARGDLPTSASIYQQLVARDAGQIPHSVSLSGLYVSQKKYEDAAKLLEGLRRLWPRNAFLAKRLAEVYDHWGKAEAALKAREQALEIDGSDLSLRRLAERARTGKELLADYAIDAKAAIALYEAQQRPPEEAAGAYVLDAAAVRAYPDGSTVDRIHIIQKVLDQSGVSDLAEVTIPNGAQVLAMRTRKPDGTVLEPENLEAKDSISMPGVEVGDYVEFEYLQAHPSRGPALKGFTSANFYFQVARMPNNWSTYVLIAPKGTGLAVDPHNMKAPAPQTRGEEEIFFHQEKHVPPFIPEPEGPPSPNEYLPFVSVGAGQTGNEALLGAVGDAYLDRGQRTFEVEQFARAASAGKSGLDAVRALYSAVMERLSGADGGIAQSASSSIAQDRGSRLWALKAGLEAIGIPARIAAVRTFGVDPAPYRFPNQSLLPYLCVRAELPDGQELWLDSAVRYAPFGELPEQAANRDAWLLPEPGKPTRQAKTPPKRNSGAKEMKLQLKISPDGKLSGTGEEAYVGFEAAMLAEALEALSPQQRTQALQGALSRYFGGAELSDLRLDLKRTVGAPLVVRYAFTSPRFARAEPDGKLILDPLTFPARLGRRFVQVGSRRTPLYIESSEHNHILTTLELPPGYALSQPAGELKSTARFGRFLRRERQEKNQLLIDETYRLDMARIPVDQYDDFARFAGEVDLMQARDLVLEKKSG
jgi:tetratricopeptide (TPR) repeat protein